MTRRPPTVRDRAHTVARSAVIFGLVLAGLGLAGPPAQADRSAGAGLGTVVLDWNDLATQAAAAACIAPLDNPLTESRMYAMTQLAVHDALNAIDRRAASYGPAFSAQHHADPRAAVVAAAHDTLISTIAEIPAVVPQTCRDAGTALVEAAYTEQLGQIPPGKAKQRGLAAGHRAAGGIIALRQGDGSDTPLIVRDFVQYTAPGIWHFTPGSDFAFAPGWGSVTPFSLKDAGQFHAPGPLSLTGNRYARDLNEVKALGGDDISTASARTADQTEIALFWWESSPTMWNRIARQIAGSRPIDAWQQARLLAQLNMGLADGYVASFATKYAELFWRPVTAIRLADVDGNVRTSADPHWTPLRPTPPIPDHDSAHAVEGGVAAGVLTGFFGTDRLRFAVCSDTVPTGACGSANPTLRGFRSVSAAAQENADSRVFIGFHFRYATEVGQRHGQQIGRWTLTHTLATYGR